MTEQIETPIDSGNSPTLDPVIAGPAPSTLRPEYTRWLPLVLLLVTAAAVSPTLTYRSVSWDDGVHITENSVVQGRGTIRDALLTPSLGYPIPLTIATYRIEHRLAGGDNTTLYHSTNALLFLAIVALLVMLHRRLNLPILASVFSVGLFAFHPANAENVAWLSARKDLLSLLFSLGAINAASRDRWGLVALFVTLSLLSKPVGAYLLIMLVPWFQTTRAKRAAGFAWLGGLLLTTLIFVAGWIGQSQVGAIDRPSTAFAYLRRIWYAAGHHLLILVGGRGPCAKYLPTWPAPFEPAVDLAPLGAVALIWFGYRIVQAKEDRKIFLIGVVGALFSYVPNSNLLPLTRFVADTYIFHPLAWLSLSIAVVMKVALEHVRPRLRLFLPAAVLGLVPAFVASEARFENSVALWTSVERLYPNDARICRNVAIAYYEQGTSLDVLNETDRCIARFGPELFRKNRGIVLYRLGRYDEALAWLESVPVNRGRPDETLALYLDLARRRIPWASVEPQLRRP